MFGRRGLPIGNRHSTGGGGSDTNVQVQDLDLPPRAGADNHRLEVVADGLPLFHGAQLAIDATWQCAITDGAAMAQARVQKERTYPELAQAHGWARLVVVGRGLFVPQVVGKR